MSSSIHSRLVRLLLFTFISLIIAAGTLSSQEKQSNKPAQRKEAAGIMTKDQAVSGPAWIYRILPFPDSSRTFIMKDAKGNEVTLTTKDFDPRREPIYVPEGHTLAVDKGSYYWYGYSLGSR